MKRIKLMLLSLVLLAGVGGALAFKAKFNTSYCTTLAKKNAAGVSTCIDPANNQTLTCPTTTHASVVDGAGAKILCTTDAIFSQDEGTYTCPQNNRLCFTTTTSLVHD